jgi:hypothetical protein
MAIDFYELGKRGAKTPKGQQSGLQSLVGGVDKTLDGMLKNQQAITATLMASSPQGVDIQKVDEKIIAKTTEMLTKNKKTYSDAAKVIASGINPQSQRYKDAIEAMNKVNTVFENMSNNLEAFALARKDATDRLDGLATNADTTRLTVHHRFANGSIYDDATYNDDGTMNYVNTLGETVKIKDYKPIGDQKFLGQNGILGLQEHAIGRGSKKGAKWEGFTSQHYKNQINQLFNTMGKEQVLDFVFSDTDFVDKFANKLGLDADFLRRNPQGDIAGEGKYDIIENFRAEKLRDVKLAFNNNPYIFNNNLNNGISKYFPSDMTYKGGVTSGQLNTIINTLDTGEIKVDGKTWNVNKENNSWKSEDGSTLSGNEMLDKLQKAFSPEFDFVMEPRFSSYRGKEKLVGTTLSTFKALGSKTKKLEAGLPASTKPVKTKRP